VIPKIFYKVSDIKRLQALGICYVMSHSAVSIEHWLASRPQHNIQSQVYALHTATRNQRQSISNTLTFHEAP